MRNKKKIKITFPQPLPPSQAQLHSQLFYLLTTKRRRRMNGGCSEFAALCLCYSFLLTIFPGSQCFGRGRQLLPTYVCCGVCLGSKRVNSVC